jgi:hypothetical protein
VVYYRQFISAVCGRNAENPARDDHITKAKNLEEIAATIIILGSENEEGAHRRLFLCLAFKVDS